MPIVKVKREDVLTGTEVQSMIDKADNDRDKCLIALLYLFGCRITEIISIKRKDVWIQDDRLFINIRILKRRESVIPYKHELMVSINAPFVSYVVDWVKTITNPEAYIIYNNVNYNAITRKTAWHIIKKTNEKAWCHLFRHTRLTRLAEQGADVNQLTQWAGLKDSRPICQNYLHRSRKIIEPLADKIT